MGNGASVTGMLYSDLCWGRLRFVALPPRFVVGNTHKIVSLPDCRSICTLLNVDLLFLFFTC